MRSRIIVNRGLRVIETRLDIRSKTIFIAV